MAQAVAHRGPDDHGLFVRGGIALGHQRLSIIDLEGGKQPMSNEDETIWISYNGEIYNYRELRRDLQGCGHVFATASDTEVIVHAYEEWGTNCVNKLRGMFAFALVDFCKGSVFLARDHFGIKPLCYRVGKGYLAFSSELNALKEVDDEQPTGSLRAIEDFLRFAYIPAPSAVYKEMRKLPPAHYLLVDFDGKISGPTRYWDLVFKTERGLSDADWEDRGEEVIRESVTAHLVADVPYGVFLSGGIDSTLVAMEMSRILDHPVEAFTIAFEEDEYSELKWAEQAASHLGIQLHVDLVKDGALEVLPDLISHYGEPFGDSSAIPTWCVSMAARERFPMVLSGDGGDEAFGGYHKYQRWMMGDRWMETGRLIRERNPRAFRSVMRGARRFLHGQRRDISADWQNQEASFYLDDTQRVALWRPEYRSMVSESNECFEEAAKRARSMGMDRLAFGQYVDFQTFLPDDILTKVDRASMFHGLEVRTPLVDLRVAEFAASLPRRQRLRYGEKGGMIRKPILKRLLERKFSADFVNRRKQGFELPRSFWFRKGRSGRNFIEDVLFQSSSRLDELFNPEAINNHLLRHDNVEDNSGALWVLLCLGVWLDQNPKVSFQ